MRRLVVVLACVALATGVLAWWVKGELEMVWLAGMPIILAGGVGFGALGSLLLSRPAHRAAAVAVAGAIALAALLLAIGTPHGWPVAPPREQVSAVERFAADPAKLSVLASRALGRPVEVGTADVERRPGWLGKRPFSFAFDRRDPELALWLAFDVGPTRPLRFDVVHGGSGWTLMPALAPAAADAEVGVTAEALRRRYPDVPVIEAAGGGRYVSGEAELLRLLHGESEWALRVVRVGADAEPLREVRRYAREELRARFDGAVAAAGLGKPAAVVTYFPAVGTPAVRFGTGEAFPFTAVLAHPRYRAVELHARLVADTVEITLGRRFTRPAAGAPGGDRR